MTRPRRKVKMRLRMAAVNAFVSRVMSCGGLLGAGRTHFSCSPRGLIIRVAHLFPFIDQAGIDLPDHRAQIKLHFADRIVLGGVGHGLRQHFVNAGKMAQQQALGALQFVILDVIRKRAELLEHLARDRFRPDVFLAHPRMPVGKRVEGGIDEFAFRLGIFELLQFLHALVVFDALHLHLRHLLVFHLVELFAQDDIRVFEDGLHQREQDRARNPALAGPAAGWFPADKATAPGPSRNHPANPRSRADKRPSSVFGNELDDLPLHQRAEQLPGAFRCAPSWLWAIRGSARSTAASPRSHRPLRLSTFSNIPCVTWKREVNRSGGAAISRAKVFLSQLTKFFSGGLRLTNFLPSLRRFLFQLEILDHVLGRLRHHPAAVVETFAPGAAADLMKIPRAQDAGLLPVEFAELGEQHRADRHIDARRPACPCRR